MWEQRLRDEGSLEVREFPEDPTTGSSPLVVSCVVLTGTGTGCRRMVNP